MLAKPFNRSVAESLLRPTGINNCWVIDDRGIWPKAEWNPALGTGNRIDFEFDSWRPAVMFATDSLPQAPGDLPVLPFPFDAKDLASFMLYGFGALVVDHYGDWENGPNPERIDDLNPLDFSRRAVKESFEAYREALKIVGPYPLELDAKAERARKAWNDADSATDKETKAVLDLEMEATAAVAKDAQEKWLEDMVRMLLKPAPVTTEGGISLGGLGDKADSNPTKPEHQPTTNRIGLDAGSGIKLPAWLDFTGNYITGTMENRQIESVKALYRALEAKAGPESPFDKGTGQNLGSLYVREISATVSLKTMQNNWKLIRSLSRKGKSTAVPAVPAVP